jgi:hypothetical protein
MQNLFSTGNQTKNATTMQFQSNPPNLQNIINSTNLNISNSKGVDSINTLPNPQINPQVSFNLAFTTPQNANTQEFNTLQNLFKTESGGILTTTPPSSTSPPAPSAFHKK